MEERAAVKKCIIISDSFKGTLSSKEICGIAMDGLRRFFPACDTVAVPVADGGEGTVACFYEACGGILVPVTVGGPYNEPVEATYLRLGEDHAVIEMASSSGLPMVGSNKDPRKTTTYGVGQQIRHAVEHGCKRITLGLGGSATNDGGCGCAAALGVKFLDRDGVSFIPVGGTLDRIDAIDVTGARALLEGVQITVMCDIDNPMHGKTGAAYIFGPQKGADPEMVEYLDRQLKAFDQAIRRSLGMDVSDVPGSGAAGAFGAGMLAFFHAELKSGIETVLDIVEFDRLLEGCDLVFTGEGQLDHQSIDGKVISGVAARAKRQNVPVIVIAGSITEEMETAPELYDLGVTAAFSINRQAQDFSVSRGRSKENYMYTFNSILRLISMAAGS